MKKKSGTEALLQRLEVLINKMGKDEVQNGEEQDIYSLRKGVVSKDHFIHQRRDNDSGEAS